METSTINKSEARRLFPSAPAWMKAKLEKDFGKGVFSGSIIDRIRSLEDAYDEVSDERRAEYDREYHSGLCADTKAFIDGKLIVDALRQDWKPNWKDGNEKKWLPIYRYSAGSGFDFSYSHYRYDNTITVVSSRLCLPNEAISDHFGKNFKEINLILLNA